MEVADVGRDVSGDSVATGGAPRSLARRFLIAAAPEGGGGGGRTGDGWGGRIDEGGPGFPSSRRPGLCLLPPHDVRNQIIEVTGGVGQRCDWLIFLPFS